MALGAMPFASAIPDGFAPSPAVRDVFVSPSPEGFRVLDGATRQEINRSSSADEALDAALAEMPEGGHATLASGLYPLTRPLILSSNTWIQGSGRTTVLTAGDAFRGEALIEGAGLKGAAVSDLTVYDGTGRAGSGILLDACGDCLIQTVLVQQFPSYGIWLRNNSFLCEVSGAKLAANEKAGVFFQKLTEGGRGGDFVPNLVTNCITYGGEEGFRTERAIVLNLVGCVVYQSRGAAFHLTDMSNSVLLSGCRTFQAGAEALLVERCDEFNATSNIFCWHRGHGIVLTDSMWATLTGNNVIDSGVRTADGSYRTGIVIRQCQGAVVNGNNVFNWGDQAPLAYGIDENEQSRNSVITSNNINYAVQGAVRAAGQGTVVEHNVAETASSYRSMTRPPYPDFTPEDLEQFVGSQNPF